MSTQDADLESALNQAKGHVVRRQHAAAENLCRQILAARPEFDDVRVLLAMSLLALKRFDEVRTEMDIVAHRQPRRWVVHWLIGESYARQGRRARALESLGRAVELDAADEGLQARVTTLRSRPDNADALLKQGCDEEELEAVQTEIFNFSTASPLRQRHEGDPFRDKTAVSFTDPSNMMMQESTVIVDASELEEVSETQHSKQNMRPASTHHGSFDLELEPTVVREAPSGLASGAGGPKTNLKGEQSPRTAVASNTRKLPAMEHVAPGRRRPRRKRRQRRVATWLLLSLLPLSVAAATFFVVRGYFERRIDTRLERVAGKALGTGTPKAMRKAAREVERRKSGNHFRQALWAHLLAASAYEQGNKQFQEARAAVDALGGGGEHSALQQRMAQGYVLLMLGKVREAQAQLARFAGEANPEYFYLNALINSSLNKDAEGFAAAKRAAQVGEAAPRYVALLALTEAKLGRTASALARIEKAEKKQSAPSLRLARARILQESGSDPVEAMQQATQLLRLSSERITEAQRAWAHLVLARQLLMQGAVPSALKHAYQASDATWYGTEEFHLAMGELYLRADSPGNARAHVGKLPEAYADGHRRALVVAQVEMAEGDYAAARRVLKEARPGPDAYMVQGEVEEAAGSYHAAKDFFERAAKAPKYRFEATLSIAGLLIKEKAHDDAFDLIQKAQNQAPEDPRVDKLAVARLLGLDKLREADERLEASLRRHPDELDLVMMKAEVSERLQDYEAAFIALGTVAEKRPRDASTQLRLANAAEQAGHVDAARQAYQAALKAEPADPSAHLGLAGLAMREGDLDAAREVLAEMKLEGDKAVRRAELAAAVEVAGGVGAAGRAQVEQLAKQHDTALLLTSLGWLELQAEQDEAAERAFRSALKKEPKTPEALLGSAVVQVHQGRTQEANALIERAEAMAEDAQVSPDRFRARVKVVRGNAAFELGELKRASTLAQEALALDEQLGEAHLLVALVKGERSQNAAAELRKAVKGIYAPPEAVARLAFELKKSKESCHFASLYLERAPQGYDATRATQIVRRCKQ